MSTNEDDLLKRVTARIAGVPVTMVPLEERVARKMADSDGTRRAALEAELFSGKPQAPQVAREPETAGSYTADYLRSIAHGLTGGLAEETLSGYAGLGAMWPGGRSPAEAVEQTRANEDRRLADFRDRHPVVSTVGDVAGMTALGVGALKAVPALAARPVAAGVAGGALYGVGDGEGAGGRTLGGVVGGVVGGATAGLTKFIPTALRSLFKPTRAATLAGGVAAGRSLVDDEPGALDMGTDVARAATVAAGTVMGGRKLAGAVSSRLANGMANQAVREAIEAGGTTAEQALAMQARAGATRASEVRMFDMSESLRGLARSAMAPFGSTARTEIPTVAGERAGARIGRLRGIKDLEEATGVRAGQSSATLRTLRGARKEASDLAYPAARRAADVTGDELPAFMDSDAMRPYVADAQERWARREAGKLASGGMPEAWNPKSVRAIDLVKKSLDEEINVARRAGRGETVSELEDLRQSLLGVVDNPGPNLRPEYGAARAGHAAASRPIDAIRAARGELKGTKSFSRASTEEVADVLGRLDDDGQTMYRLGAIDDFANTKGLRNFGPESDQWEKLRVLIGDDDVVDTLAGRRSVEALFTEAADQLTAPRGSRTQFGEMDILSARDWSNFVRDALQEMIPKLSTSKQVGSEVGRILQLQGDDLVNYLRAVEKQAQMELVRRGRMDLLAAGLGTVAAAGVAPKLSGNGGDRR